MTMTPEENILPMPTLSPSLRTARDGLPSFEVKFCLTEPAAIELEALLAPRMLRDPHGDHRGAYRITSVYFDTPALDVYRRGDGHRVRKFRLRRYGTDAMVYLERKSKRGEKVRKKRTSVALADVGRLAGLVEKDWEGAWFADQLARRGLRPTCQVSYERVAYLSKDTNGPIRLTFDREAYGLGSASLQVTPVQSGVPLLHGEVIAEFKFVGAMPAIFKEALEKLRISPTAVSKYRRCIERCQQPPRSAIYA